MPRHIEMIAWWGNAFLIVCFGFLTLFMFVDDTRSPALALFFAVPAAMGVFNIWVVAKSARLLAEEEWLRGEVRKAVKRVADLQKQIALRVQWS